MVSFEKRRGSDKEKERKDRGIKCIDKKSKSLGMVSLGKERGNRDGGMVWKGRREEVMRRGRRERTE